MNLKKKKEGKKSRTRGHFLSVLLLYFLSPFTVTFFYYFYPVLLFLPTNHTILGLLIFFFLYMKEHLNLCDFQNKMWMWVLKRKRKRKERHMKGLRVKKIKKDRAFFCVLNFFSRESLIMQTCSPVRFCKVPSLYSVLHHHLCPLCFTVRYILLWLVSISVDRWQFVSLHMFVQFPVFFCSMTVFLVSITFCFCWIFQHKFLFFSFCFYLRIYHFIYVIHFIFPNFIYFIL